MTYVNFRGLPKLNAPGVWIGGIPSHVYSWVVENIEEPDWDFRNEMFLGIILNDEDATIIKLKFAL